MLREYTYPNMKESGRWARVKGLAAAARKRGGGLFNAASGENAERFAPNALPYVLLWELAFAAFPCALILAFAYLVRPALPSVVFVPAILCFAAWYGLKYVRSFMFRLDGMFLHVRHGVFMHAHTLLPYENIQDIHVTQGILERLFGLNTVIIFTATTSGAGAETVPWLTRDGAERLKAALFARMREARHVTD
jgi:membrane protein YdbS with pleckstrin-like domain